jgi:uncharacterized coiled-coil DUF342 family protein
MSDNADITKLKVDVGQLQVQVTTLTNLCSKMDTVIDKLVDQQDKYVAQVYKDMESRRTEKNAEVKEIHDRIDTVIDKVQITELRLLKEIAEMRKQLSEHSAKEQTSIDKLNQWKWTITGGIVVISWLMSHGLDVVAKIFLTK